MGVFSLVCVQCIPERGGRLEVQQAPSRPPFRRGVGSWRHRETHAPVLPRSAARLYAPGESVCAKRRGGKRRTKIILRLTCTCQSKHNTYCNELGVGLLGVCDSLRLCSFRLTAKGFLLFSQRAKRTKERLELVLRGREEKGRRRLIWSFWAMFDARQSFTVP